MDKATIQYIEGKNASFDRMLRILKTIRQLQKDGLLIMEHEELNDKYLEETIDRAQEFLV